MIFVFNFAFHLHKYICLAKNVLFCNYHNYLTMSRAENFRMVDIGINA